jgi:hypothetical protein
MKAMAPMHMLNPARCILRFRLRLCAAEAMESELSPILMQDTVGFVMKLKRLVIYECERSALQKRFS